MPSRGSRRRPARLVAGAAWLLWIAAAVLMLAGWPDGALHAAQPSNTANPPAAGTVEGGEVRRALDRLRQDPNLGPERTIRSLRWKGPTSRQPARPPGWFRWLRDLAGWMDQSARVLVWIVVGVAVVLLIGWIARHSQGRAAALGEEAFVAPTHVRELDIRPEALPADVGAAARALWDAGDQRAALSLLYRGLLSRLVHAHRVPIKASSTEGDCLALASTRLGVPALDFSTRLVRTWQRAVYGQQPPATTAVHALCDEFAVALAAGRDTEAA